MNQPDTYYKEKDKHGARSSKFMALTGIMAGGALLTFIAAPEIANQVSPAIYAWVIPGITAMAGVGYAGIAGALISKAIKDNTSAEEIRPFRQRLIEKIFSNRINESQVKEPSTPKP